MKSYLKVFFILLLIPGLIACNNKVNQDYFLIKTNKEWIKETVKKVESGYIDSNELYIDYSDIEVELSIDELWRSIEVYNISGFNYDEKILKNALIKIKPTNDREKIEYDYICNVLKGCDKQYYDDYNKLVNDLFNKNNKMEPFEKLDTIYLITTHFFSELTETSKNEIISWLKEHDEEFKQDIGLLYTILEIEDILKVDIFDLSKDRLFYKDLLAKSLNRDNIDLIEFYYLFYINLYLDNSINEDEMRNKLMGFYDTDNGFSLSTNEFIDGNLGSYLGIKIMVKLNKLDIIQNDLLKVLARYEKDYGGLINIENTPSGSMEETIMANYVLNEISNDSTDTVKLKNKLKSSNINWFWTYYSISQSKEEIPAEYKEMLFKKLANYEYEVINTTFTEKEYDQLLESSGILSELEYFSKVGSLLGYTFKEEYKEKINLINKNLINKISREEIDVLNSLLEINQIFEMSEDYSEVKMLVSDLIDNNNTTNFYEWYSIIKSAKHLGIIQEQQDISNLLEKYINPNGGVNGDLEIESSDTLYSTFLMLSLVKEMNME